MARYRTYTVEFKRQLVEEHLGGGTSLNQLARRHDISRELLRTWVKKYEAGEFASGGSPRADHRAYEAKIAGLERKVGQLTMELDLLGEADHLTLAECRDRPAGRTGERVRPWMD